MTVGELIEQLQNYEPNARVLVDGYELGYDDPRVHIAEVVNAQGNGPKKEWWNGRYLDAHRARGVFGTSPSFMAVVIGR